MLRLQEVAPICPKARVVQCDDGRARAACEARDELTPGVVCADIFTVVRVSCGRAASLCCCFSFVAL